MWWIWLYIFNIFVSTQYCNQELIIMLHISFFYSCKWSAEGMNALMIPLFPFQLWSTGRITAELFIKKDWFPSLCKYFGTWWQNAGKFNSFEDSCQSWWMWWSTMKSEQKKKSYMHMSPNNSPNNIIKYAGFLSQTTIQHKILFLSNILERKCFDVTKVSKAVM